MPTRNYERLADRILVAMQMSLDQKDPVISDLLGRALEMALTRGAGGKDFVERRDFDDDIKKVMIKLDEIKKA